MLGTMRDSYPTLMLCLSLIALGEMNHKMIDRWLEDKLIPNLPPKYVFVIDNAAYHNVQVDRRPVRATIQE